ncbi:hypothetical protein PVAP13_3KG361127 [Panicum virgatum]|uniref:Uncharacterized protein n=1 Tax=Panicum virgatum TaxID=38727 RepID=A0A8T0UX36_PANVG|nr:hypothetical protein PVAP13_3KG361127 [Panicum virgatum]
MVFPIESTHGVVRQKWVGLIFLQDAVAVALALLTLAHGTGPPTGRLSPAGKRRKTDTDRLDPVTKGNFLGRQLMRRKNADTESASASAAVMGQDY